MSAAPDARSQVDDAWVLKMTPRRADASERQKEEHGMSMNRERSTGGVGNYMMVTPAMALAWLKTNTTNRPASKSIVAMYTRDMAEDRWGQSDQPIILSDESLLDGQHRLMAVVASGTTQRFLVIFGADPAQFQYLDRGKKRTGADVLGISGEENTSRLTAVLGWIDTYERRGQVPPRGARALDVVGLLEKWPEARDSTQVFCAKRNRQPWLRTVTLAGVHALATRFQRREFADRFYTDVVDGTGMSPDDPVWQLRELLIRNDSASHKMSADHLFKIMIRAVNLRATGRTTKFLRFYNSKVRTEQFPAMTGDPKQ